MKLRPPSATAWFIAAMLGLMTVYIADAAQKQRATQFPGWLVVTTCGTLPSGITYTAGNYEAGTQDINGKHCVNQ